VRLQIYSWFMKYCHPKLASAGVIAGDVGRRQHMGWASLFEADTLHMSASVND